MSHKIKKQKKGSNISIGVFDSSSQSEYEDTNINNNTEFSFEETKEEQSLSNEIVYNTVFKVIDSITTLLLSNESKNKYKHELTKCKWILRKIVKELSTLDINDLHSEYRAICLILSRFLKENKDDFSIPLAHAQLEECIEHIVPDIYASYIMEFGLIIDSENDENEDEDEDINVEDEEENEEEDEDDDEDNDDEEEEEEDEEDEEEDEDDEEGIENLEETDDEKKLDDNQIKDSSFDIMAKLYTSASDFILSKRKNIIESEKKIWIWIKCIKEIFDLISKLFTDSKEYGVETDNMRKYYVCLRRSGDELCKLIIEQTEVHFIEIINQNLEDMLYTLDIPKLNNDYREMKIRIYREYGLEYTEENDEISENDSVESSEEEERKEIRKKYKAQRNLNKE